MYKPDDKDIDRLSREAAEHYRAPGEPSWDALQQVLDKELPQEKEKKRRGFFFFFFLLLGLSVAGTGVWYGLRINTNKNATTQAGKTAPENPAAASVATATAGNVDKDGVKPSGQPAAAATKAPETSTAAKDAASTPVATTTATDKPSSADKTVVAPPTSTNASDNKNSGQPVASSIKALPLAGKQKKNGQGIALTGSRPPQRDNLDNNIAGTGNKPNKPIRQTIAGKTTPKGQSSVPDKNAGSTEMEETDVNKVSANETAVVPEPQTQQPATSTTTDTSATVTKAPAPVAAQLPAAAKDSTAVAKKKSKTPSRAINIGITGGVDKSTIKFTHGDNAGYNIGIMGGYQFSKHWSAYTGVIYTKKNYTLNGEDYHPPKHYWTQYVQLDLVDGYCKMWELPLQARYTFNPEAKTAFFASAGLSSYFMKKQGYMYYYKSNGIPGTNYWTNDSTFNHFFSVLHLSAGFEKRIGKNLNWQIEPYAKIPLGGVGFGNIRLSSFGINLSVQYRKPLKR